MEECSFDIRGHNFQVVNSGIGKNNANASHLGNRRIRIVKVLRTLAETLSNKTGLLLSLYNGPIRIVLVGVHPTNTYRMTPRRKISNLKSISRLETVHLTIHSSLPDCSIRARASFMVSIRRFQQIICTRGTKIAIRIRVDVQAKFK